MPPGQLSVAEIIMVSLSPPGASLLEHGFWDYTAAGAGGMEGYEADDYRALLDDMSEAGMNSVLVLPKWISTGYRSRLPFLDQHPDNPVTRSDNALLRDFLDDARRRGVKTWLGAVVSAFPTRSLRSAPHSVHDGVRWGCPIPGGYGEYDSDCPELAEYGPAVFGELHELFPGVDGFMVELEWASYATPHRVPLYNAWAEANGRPPFDRINQPMNGRTFDFSPWREYATHRRTEHALAVERALRERGFRGEFAMLCETGQAPNLIGQEVNLDLFRERCPGWSAVSYEYSYNKAAHRLGMMEMAVELPRKAGLRTYYLPRGVMTWPGGGKPLPVPLRESWRRDAEDIARFRPEGVWWFGSGHGGRDGSHVRAADLCAAGFADGRETRRALLATLAEVWGGRPPRDARGASTP